MEIKGENVMNIISYKSGELTPFRKDLLMHLDQGRLPFLLAVGPSYAALYKQGEAPVHAIQ
jgi:hypothetical protein